MSETTATAPAKGKPWSGAIATIFFVLVLLWFVHSIAEVLLLLFAAILIGIYLGTIIDWSTNRFGTGRSVGVLIAVSVTMAITGLIGFLVVPPLIDELTSLFRSLPSLLSRIDTDFAPRLLRRYPELAAVRAEDPTGGYVASIVTWLSGYFDGVVRYLFQGATAAIHLASVLVMGLYLAIHPRTYRDGALALVPPVHRSLAADMFDEMLVDLRAWIAGLFLSMISLGALSYLGFLLLDVPYPLAFGVFTGMASIVPFFGTAVSTLVPALVVLGDGSFTQALLVVLLGIVIHLVEANLIAPLIMQRQIALPPVLSVLAVLIMADLLGFVGLLIAVPVLAVVMVIVQRLYVGRILEGKGFRKAIREGGGAENRRPLSDVPMTPDPGVSVPDHDVVS